MGVSTTRKDRGADAIRKFAERNKSVKGAYVAVGVLESAGTHKGPGGMSVAQIATIHEFGTERVPERSFLRSTFKEKFKGISAMIQDLKPRVIRQQLSIEKALGLIGERFRADVINKINSGINPANSPQTIKRKGSSKPLIDTGQLKQSINYEVKT